jgi:ubiquinone/menaquinone biosynthesis C-methylase UbiE
MTQRRLNWGCGTITPPGWINADKIPSPGVDLAGDILHGLCLDDDSVDYAVSIHALVELPFAQIEDALWELRRVLKRGGVLRLGLPDLDKAIDAYRRGDAGYFLIPHEVCTSLSGKLIAQIVWYGRSRTPMTYEFTAELLQKAGFRNICRCDFRQTAGPFPAIVDLDNREQESFFVEAVK